MEELTSITEMMPRSDIAPNRLLYHYTSAEGLRGIIENRCIWATHVRYLNDLEEFRHAFSRALTDVLFDALIPGVHEELKELLHGKLVQEAEKSEAFVICVTDDQPLNDSQNSPPGDRLSQWRGYAGHSGGFSLGFDVVRAVESFSSLALRRAGGVLWLFQCVYHDGEKKALVRQIGEMGFSRVRGLYDREIERFVTENRRCPDESETKLIVERSAIAGLSCASVPHLIRACQLKHQAFSEEREWRAVFLVPRNKLQEAQTSEPQNPILKFRTGKFGITPYIEYRLDLNSDMNPLRRIVVGPGPHQAEEKAAVERLLAANEVNGVDVDVSLIPYRD